MLVRWEEATDKAAVYALNESAFGTSAEANLVDILRREAQPIVSLVAEDNKIVVGHIMFTAVSLSGHPGIKIMGLAPLAVAPLHQNTGIGTTLVHAGLQQCKASGYGAAVVLGHPGYYPRFGFKPSARFGIGCEYEVSEEKFMVMELQEGYLHGKTGIIKYHSAFTGL
ncbi:MAG: N-acetyltransferase [Gammaproteobacteria bacterium]|nr:N-acetyltransferase [Gammaproteobacteria bacterium]